jgi:hypothetical protein
MPGRYLLYAVGRLISSAPQTILPLSIAIFALNPAATTGSKVHASVPVQSPPSTYLGKEHYESDAQVRWRFFCWFAVVHSWRKRFAGPFSGL